MSDDEGVTPDEVVAHITPELVTPALGKGTLGTWRSPATPGLRAGVCLAAKLGLTCQQTAHEGRMRVRRLTLSRSREGLRAISRGQNRTRENRPSGIAGGSWETWQMAEIGTHAADRKGGHGHSSPSCARAQVLPDRGAGHSCRERLGQPVTGGAERSRQRAAALTGWHEPCDWRQSRTVL